jgi:hypothetical protein
MRPLVEARASIDAAVQVADRALGGSSGDMVGAVPELRRVADTARTSMASVSGQGEVGQWQVGEAVRQLDLATERLGAIEQRIGAMGLGHNSEAGLLQKLTPEVGHAVNPLRAAGNALPGVHPGVDTMVAVRPRVSALLARVDAARTPDDIRAIADETDAIAGELGGARDALRETARALPESAAVPTEPTWWRLLGANSATHDLEVSTKYGRQFADRLASLESGTARYDRELASYQSYTAGTVRPAISWIDSGVRGVPHDYKTMLDGIVPTSLLRST